MQCTLIRSAIIYRNIFLAGQNKQFICTGVTGDLLRCEILVDHSTDSLQASISFPHNRDASAATADHDRTGI